MQRLLLTGSIIAAVTLIGLASRYFLGNDNPVEQVCEDVIHSETGVEIDLSPEVTGESGNSAAS